MHYTRERKKTMPPCVEDECEKPAVNFKTGLCAAHYDRLRRRGTTALPTRSERFWSKVDKDGPVPSHRPDLGCCWLWTKGAYDGHYGLFSLTHTTNTVAHRFAYADLVGPIPDGLKLDHLCRVTLCVRPSHLEPVTTAENNRRAGAMVTHCPQDHEYTPENTYRSPNGGRRQCRTCNRERWRRQNAARKQLRLTS